MTRQLLHCIVAVGVEAALGQANEEQSAAASADGEKRVQFLLQGMKAHHERFPFVRAKWRLMRNARATTYKDAMAGRWLANPAPIVARVSFAFAGGRFRLDESYDEETLKRSERRLGGQVVRELFNRSYIWNQSLVITAEAGRAVCVARVEGSFGWDLFRGGRALPLYQMPERYGGTFEYLGERELKSRLLPVVRYRIGQPKPTGPAEQKPGLPPPVTYMPSVRTTYSVDDCYIDPDRGFSVACVITRSGPVETRPDDLPHTQVYVVQDFRDVGDGRWLPVLVRFANLGQTPPTGYEVAVNEIDVEHAPGDDVFEVQVPPGSSGFDRIRYVTFVAEAGRVSLASFHDDGTPVESDTRLRWNLGGSASMGWPHAGPGPQGPVGPSVPPRQGGSVWIWTFPATSLALLLLIVACRAARRAKK